MMVAIPHMRAAERGGLPETARILVWLASDQAPPLVAPEHAVDAKGVLLGGTVS